MDPNLCIDPIALRSIIKNVKVGSSDNIVERVITAPNTESAGALDSLTVKAINSEVNYQSRKPEVVITQAVSDEDWAVMVSMYPEYKLTRHPKYGAPHSTAAAYRTLERKLIKSFCIGSENIVDIGGNPIHHIKDGDLVHCCQPLIDSRDAARSVIIQRQLNTMMNGANKAKYPKTSRMYKVICEFEKSLHSDKYVCHNRGENCKAPADTLMFLHSNYDIPLAQLPEIMIAHGADMAIGCLLFKGEMLIQPTGVIDSHHCLYSIANGKIHFAFKGDMSLNYSHTWENYIEYATSNGVVSSGIFFSYEIIDVRGGVLFYRMINTKSPVSSNLMLGHTVWLDSMAELRVVRVFEAESLRRVMQRRGLVKSSVVMMPEALYQRVWGWLASNSDVEYKSLISYARSANSRVVLNGTTVTTPVSMSIEDLEKACMSLYIARMIADIDRREIFTVMRNNINAIRDSEKSTFHLIANAIKKFIGVGDYAIKDDIKILNVLRSYIVSGIDVPVISKANDKLTFVTTFGEWFITSKYNPVHKYTSPNDDDNASRISRAKERAKAWYMSDTISSMYNYEELLQIAYDEASVKPWRSFIDRVETLNDRDRVVAIEAAVLEFVKNGAMPYIPDSVCIDDPIALYNYAAKKSCDELRAVVLSNEIEGERLETFTTIPDVLDEQTVKDDEIDKDNNRVSRVVAVREAIRYVLAMEKSTNSFYKDAYNYIIKTKHSNYVNTSYGTHQEMVRVINEADPDYCRAMTDSGIVDMNEATYPAIVGESLRYPSAMRMASALELSIEKMNKHVKLTLHEGVAGSGKTYRMINIAKPSDLIISPFRANVAELRQSQKLLSKVGNNIRTINSVLYADKFPQAKRVLVDEALAAHAGMIYAVAALTGACEVICQGDSKQIPFVNFTDINLVHANIDKWDEVEYYDTTRRCPQDIAVAMSDIYERPISSTNPVVNSVTVTPAVSWPVTLSTNRCYLAMYNTEVEYLRSIAPKEMHKNITTVHRAQGLTFDNVTFVRLNKADKELYNSVPYLLVAITRHKNTFEYIRIGKPDKLTKLISNLATQVMQTNIVDITPSYNYEGVAYTEEDVTRPKCTRNSKIVDIVAMRNDASTLEDVEVPMVEFHDVLEPREFRIVPKIDAPVQAMQDLYDSVLPGVSVHDNRYDQQDVEYTDLSVSTVGEVSFSDPCTVIKNLNGYEPLLRTGAPIDVTDNIKETLIAYAKRNGDAPNVRIAQDEYTFQLKAWDAFTRNMCVKNYRTRLRKYRRHLIDVTQQSLSEWYFKQDELKRSAIDGIVMSNCESADLTYMPGDKLSLLVKKKRKPTMDYTSVTGNPPSQTLTFSSKDWNMIYGGIMNRLETRLKSILKPNVAMVTDKSDVEIENTMTRFIRKGNQEWLELDISKFDKSQTEQLLDLEMYVYEQLGIDKIVAEVYKPLYGDTVVLNYKTGFKMFLHGQRKSGAPSTLLGNTIVNMICVNYALDIREFDYCAFKGDDSIFARPGKINGSYGRLESLCNFDAKPIIRKYAYFCSSFVIEVPEGWRLLPDPIKRIESMGSKNLATDEHIYDKYISLGDLMRNYADMAALDELVDAVSERYQCNKETVLNGCMALSEVSRNFNNFRNLWKFK